MHLAYRPKDSMRGHGMKSIGTIQFISPWGLMFMSTSELGIYRIGFPDDPIPDTPFVGKHIAADYYEMFNCIDNRSLPIDVAQNLQNVIDFINGKNHGEDIWLCPICTDFQFLVYRELLKIPFGKTATYSEVAAAIGQPTATRAVATAIAKNPLAVIVPCHRIVPASGGIGNYFWGADRKRQILEYEARK